MYLFQRLRFWMMRLTYVLRLGQAGIHPSLLVLQGVLAAMVAVLSLSRPGMHERSEEPHV